MHRFRVWAPTAARVDVETDPTGTPSTTAMAAEDGGWWAADGAAPGTDYLFHVDGGPGRPDPRSAWQPHGVHGPSRVVDPGEHAWTDGAWRGLDVRGAVFYELHVGTFTEEGTLDAAVARLDHLVQLGVQVVSLMPVAAFPGRWGWGYDGVSLFAVHDPYGGPAAMQRFVDACHGRGLAVCLDVVYNHLGPSGNYLSDFGPYFTDTHQTPWGSAVNLDAEGSHEVRRFVVDNALRWFRDFHVDALRLDAVHALVDDSEQHLLAQLSVETDALAAELGRPLALVAESDLNDVRVVTPVADGGWGMTAQWSDDFHHALHTLLTGERQGYYADFGDVSVLAKTLTEVFLHDGGHSTFRGRPWGAPVDRATTSGHLFLAYASNHDQVGNRATGDRPAATLPPGLQAVGAALTVLSPFSPMLFMGEEWGAATPWLFFTDHGEPELAAAIRDGRRAEFASHGWDSADVPDPQSEATRDASVLRWEEIGTDPHQRLLAWYRQLVGLRRREADLADGRLDRVEVTADDAGWLVLHRGAFRVVCNPTEVDLDVRLDAPVTSVTAAWDGAMIGQDGVRLPARSVAVVRVGEVSARAAETEEPA